MHDDSKTNEMFSDCRCNKGENPAVYYCKNCGRGFPGRKKILITMKTGSIKPGQEFAGENQLF